MEYSIENIDKHIDHIVDCVVRLAKHLKKGTTE